MESKDSLLFSQETAVPLIQRTCETFRNKLTTYGEQLLAPRPTPSCITTPFWLSATAYSYQSI